MTIKQIHYFIAVAETKSFTNAARNYFIAQTAMSQQISALEKELGFLLFHRSNRSVELTQAGQVLYDQAPASGTQSGTCRGICLCHCRSSVHHISNWPFRSGRQPFSGPGSP